jgi:hypothetical protein
MGKIICEKHGEQGIVLTCEHVRQAILTGSSTIDSLIKGEAVAGTFLNETVAFTVGYCETCAKQHGLPLNGGVLPDSAMEFIERAEPVCAKCFEVALPHP